MTELREALEHAREVAERTQSIRPAELEGFRRYQSRRQRRQRAGSVVLALALAVVAISGVIHAFSGTNAPVPASHPSVTLATPWDSYHPRGEMGRGEAFGVQWVFFISGPFGGSDHVCLGVGTHVPGAGGYGSGRGCHHGAQLGIGSGSGRFATGFVPRRTASVEFKLSDGTSLPGRVFPLPLELRDRFKVKTVLIIRPSKLGGTVTARDADGAVIGRWELGEGW